MCGVVHLPQVLKCKELGRAMRIGTNHGSLSARILSFYGDTPRWVVGQGRQAQSVVVCMAGGGQRFCRTKVCYGTTGRFPDGCCIVSVQHSKQLRSGGQAGTHTSHSFASSKRVVTGTQGGGIVPVRWSHLQQLEG